jgi:hypothetical protein
MPLCLACPSIHARWEAEFETAMISERGNARAIVILMDV